MTTTELITLARKHAVTASANLYLADAVRLDEAGCPDHAKFMALKSLAYSVGESHEDYILAAG